MITHDRQKFTSPVGINCAFVTRMTWPSHGSGGLSPRRPASVYVGFVVDKVVPGQVFLCVLPFILSISFHRSSTHIYIVIWRLNNKPAGGRSSDSLTPLTWTKKYSFSTNRHAEIQKYERADHPPKSTVTEPEVSSKHIIGQNPKPVPSDIIQQKSLSV